MDRAHVTRIAVTVNGEPRAAEVDNRMSLLDLLREREPGRRPQGEDAG